MILYGPIRISFTLITLMCGQFVNGRPPNIVLIVADDFGWNDVGYHGSEIRTPTLDKLAASGVKLENYYVQPICSPTRSQLMSGRYQIHTGLQHGVIRPQQPNALPKDIPTLADKLREKGYSTHIIGKWHLGFYKEEFMPTYRGFDSHYGYLVGAEDYYTHIRDGGLDFRHNLEVVRDQNGSYSAEVFARRAESLIQSHAKYNQKQPMFLYLPFQSVHAPLEVPQRYLDQYSFIKDRNRRIYAGMVTALDEAVKNITTSLMDHNMWNDTLLIFSTDNGGQVLEGGNNWPLRGWKAQLWEGGIRGVGFVTGPVVSGTGQAGTVSREMVHVSDWFPTLVHLAGGDTSGMGLDGYDVWSTISQKKPSPRKELLHNIDPLHPAVGQRWDNSSFDNRVRAAIRVGDWKLITGDPGPGKWIPPPHLVNPSINISSLLESRSKYDGQNVWLFNIREDPVERMDLSAIYPERVLLMLRRLAQYNSTMVPCRYPAKDSRSNPRFHGGVWGPWET